MSTGGTRAARSALAAAAALVAACGGGAPAPQEEPGYAWVLPQGFPVPEVPADNPMSAAKVELGRRLFYDVRLSGNQTFSCASCHRQELAFSDGRARGLGSTGMLHPRGPQPLVNLAYLDVYTWANSVVPSLEIQALVPMTGFDPIELGIGGWDAEVAARLQKQVRPYDRIGRYGGGKISLELFRAHENLIVSGDADKPAGRPKSSPSSIVSFPPFASLFIVRPTHGGGVPRLLPDFPALFSESFCRPGRTDTAGGRIHQNKKVTSWRGSDLHSVWLPSADSNHGPGG